MKFSSKLFLLILIVALAACAPEKKPVVAFTSKLVPVGEGWAENSVNATIFRKNSVVSSANYQFVAYYDSTAHVVLARREHNTEKCEVYRTQYTGNIRDAHNVISLMVDGEGYLHLSWDHHNNPLHYCRSLEPESLEMGEMVPMVGENEQVVSYPEFYKMADGGLLFAYRDGGSGNGNLVLNRYELTSKSWSRLQTNLIDGESQRNAYWQLFVDRQGTIHVSWVWRETPDVHSNHDMCYACSKDGGLTWQKSTGEEYQLPITMASAEIVKAIPQGSNLINQTSMTTDADGNPFIATYFKQVGDSCTQFYIIYRQKGEWKASAATKRTLDFELGGVGSRSIPISRPQLMILKSGEAQQLVLIYRDEEVDNNVVLSTSELADQLEWSTQIVSPYPVDRWEPSYDTELLKDQNKLQLYFQRVAQGQAETTVPLPPQPVGILELEMN
ncbi:BNR repeat-containing protein [Mangrovibacterium diazotrophicum]|uniref:Putative BNR repeat neuraminidase n=1 Tax=Mangrovibacterium diazotrophicum TaxID=1261403 RepID=A0A419W5F0_9BACT|nr:BNR repeat-containing protein [Mangrovibacterium diazotrophicum]RKD90677.1 putative BNR repeat neuraminidase [Mangrovibacterium diazotrophicum]